MTRQRSVILLVLVGAAVIVGVAIAKKVFWLLLLGMGVYLAVLRALRALQKGERT
jgi:hypothetical protein